MSEDSIKRLTWEYKGHQIYIGDDAYFHSEDGNEASSLKGLEKVLDKQEVNGMEKYKGKEVFVFGRDHTKLLYEKAVITGKRVANGSGIFRQYLYEIEFEDGTFGNRPIQRLKKVPKNVAAFKKIYKDYKRALDLWTKTECSLKPAFPPKK